MMKHEEMITLIGNMFINAYVAGDRKDLDSFRSARADRDHLFDEISNLYAELEHESYEREQFENELKAEQERRQNFEVENCMKMYDDAGKFSEQDLPFPDVDDLAPASEVEGSEE